MRRLVPVSVGVPLFVLLGGGGSGCAQWVWNTRHVPCQDTRIVEFDTWSKPSAIRAGPYIPDELEDLACEARTAQLFGGGMYVGDTELEMWNVGRLDFRYTADGLYVDEFTSRWDDCDDDEGWTCGSGQGALVELERVVQGDNEIHDTRIESESTGQLDLVPDGIDLFCSDCSVRAALKHSEPVQIVIENPKDLVHLCLDVPSEVDITIRGTGAETPVIIELVSTPLITNLDFQLDDGPVQLRFASVFATGDEVVQVSGDVVNTNEASDGRCEPLEFTWPND